MKNFILSFIFLNVLFIHSKCRAQTEADYKIISEKVITAFVGNDFESIYNRFGNLLKKQMDLNDIESFWYNLNLTFGDFETTDEIKVEAHDTLTIAFCKLKFKKLKFILQLTYDNKQELVGLFLLPDKITYSPAPYAIALKFYELKPKTPVSPYQSDAVLTMPINSDNNPVVIIVGGSGPTDKDGTIGANKPYRDIAEGLSSKGIAVYRYNKRSVQYAKEMATNKNLTVEEEYTQDLKGIVKWLKKTKGINKNEIYIAAHSQAGYLMGYFEKNIKGIKGYIGLAPGFRYLEESLLWQLNYIIENSNSTEAKLQIKKMISYAEYTLNNLLPTTPADSLIPGTTATYLMHLRKQNPKHTAKYLYHKPVLILRGDKDYQVTELDIEYWNKAMQKAKNYQTITYSGLNHIFMEVKTKNKYCLPEDYNIPGNVLYHVIDDIYNWIKNQN